MSGLFRHDVVTPRYSLFPREIFRRDEEDRRRRCRGHRRGGLTKYPAEKIRGTAGVVRELCGLGALNRSVVFKSSILKSSITSGLPAARRGSPRWLPR